MIAIRTTVRMLAARRQAPALRADIADLLHSLAKALFDPYRPELHYMRGPGSEVANEAHAQCTVRELIGNNRGILRQELDQ
jgi:hypothetical protein